MWSIVDLPLICCDGDVTGWRVAKTIAHRALPMLTSDRSLAFVHLSDNLDPDDFVRRHGRVAFEILIDGAMPIAEFLTRSVLSDLQSEGAFTEKEAVRRLEDLSGRITDAAVRIGFLRSVHAVIACAIAIG